MSTTLYHLCGVEIFKWMPNKQGLTDKYKCIHKSIKQAIHIVKKSVHLIAKVSQ